MRIVISGAGGKTGQAVRRALAARGADVRPFLHHPTPDPNAIVGDMTRAADWARALDGAAAVLHICPNMHPAEVEIGRLALAAARAAGVRHFVYHSVLHPQTEAMPHHWQKLRVEELLLASGLPFTILQPTAYMQNIRAGWAAIRQEGRYVVPYPPGSRISLVDVHDVAAAAARVLTEPGHEGATYELAGTPPLAQSEVAAVLADVLGRPVAAEALPLDAWQQTAVAAGLSAYAVDTLRRMFVYYARHGLAGSPNVLRWLLGREPTTLAACVARWKGRQA
ncbi:MAG: NmrA family NAD(P)-binding protein [Anaerolineales bacterium]|nr:NmrA family NAD(P)-binding protein [Anaerolineales bacterium]